MEKRGRFAKRKIAQDKAGKLRRVVNKWDTLGREKERSPLPLPLPIVPRARLFYTDSPL